MSGAQGVAAVVLLESVVGLVAGGAWTQSWAVVRRGHFRIVAWTALALAGLAVVAGRAAAPTTLEGAGGARALVAATAVGAVLYLLAQYARADAAGAAVGAATGVVGAGALLATADLISGWPAILAALELVVGAALVGAVTNGMLLGHWYLNQPGLKPWALARLTTLALAATAASIIGGLAAAGRLAGADTAGAVLGLPGFGASFGAVFFGVWLALAGFTGVVVWMARRCVNIRSIQSATGLYYVALLTAGVGEFLVRYLMLGGRGPAG